MNLKQMNSFSLEKGLDFDGFRVKSTKVLQAILLMFLVGYAIGHPGIEVTVTQLGIDYFSGSLAKEIYQHLVGRELTYAQTFETGDWISLAFLHYEKFADIKMPSYTVRPKAGVGLEARLTEMDLAITGRLVQKVRGITRQSPPEDVTIEMKGVNTTLLVKVVIVEGQPVVKIPTCSTSRSEEVSVHYQPNSVIAEDVNIIEPELGKYLEKIICNEVSYAIMVLLTKRLHWIGLSVAGPTEVIDLSLLGVEYASDFVKFSHKGTFVGDDEELQFCHMNTTLEQMVSVSISRHVMESYLRSHSGSFSVSYPMKLLGISVEALGLNRSKSGIHFLVSYKSRLSQTVHITPDGITTKASGTLRFVSTKDSKATGTVDVDITNFSSVDLDEDGRTFHFRLLKQTLLLKNDKLMSSDLQTIRESLSIYTDRVAQQMQGFLMISFGIKPMNSTLVKETDYLKVIYQF